MPKNYPLRILLVEDHPFQLLATQCLLKSFGFEHLTLAENAEQAIRLDDAGPKRLRPPAVRPMPARPARARVG